MSNRPVPRGAVVVGVDGSSTSDQALDWAVEEAARRALPLHIIHAFSYGYPMTDIGVGYAIDGLRQLADSVRKDAVARARRAGPDLVITWSEPACRPAPALLEASETADTVVLGARGTSAARGVFIGSVPVQVAARAACPVVIVHNTPAKTGAEAPVVVGVDGSDLSSSAIAYAYGQASSRGVGLTVVHAWWLDHIDDVAAAAIWTVDWQTFAVEEQRLVAESLAAWEEKYPDVPVRRHSVRGLPVEALVRQSQSACLVVVGTRGRGGFGGLLLGSVSQGVMHRALCPVTIVHGHKEPKTDWDDLDAPDHHVLPVPPVRDHT